MIEEAEGTERGRERTVGAHCGGGGSTVGTGTGIPCACRHGFESMLDGATAVPAW